MLMALSLVVLTVAQFHLYPDAFRIWMIDLFHQNASLLREYVIIISGGIFTSTVVTLIIAIREYKDVRVAALENYYNVSSSFLGNYRNIQYLSLDQPFDIVQGCIWEEAENKRKINTNMQIDELIKKSGGKKSKNKKIVKKAYEKISFEEKEKMKDYIWNCTDEETKRRINNAEIKNQYLEDEYKIVMQNYYVKIDDAMKQYIQIKKLDYAMVEAAFGKIDFIFANQKLRKRFIYKHLHDKQRSVLHTIMQEAWHFEEYYKMGNGNLPVMLSKIMKIQDGLFQKQEGEVGYTIYNSYCYEIDKQLSELLSITYGKGYKKMLTDIKDYAVFSKIEIKK